MEYTFEYAVLKTHYVSR